MFTVVLVPADTGFHVVSAGLNVSVAGGVWVTVSVRAIPVTDTVIVPVLVVVPWLAAAITLNEPLPVRLAGTKLSVVSHETLLCTCHVLFESTLNTAEMAEEVIFQVDCDIASTAGGATCDTATVRVVTPGADTDIVPVLVVVPVFAVALILKEPFLIQLQICVIDLG